MAAHDPPHPAFRFEVRIDDVASGSFSECSGLVAATELVEYREGGVNDRVQHFVGAPRATTLILKRGIVDRELCDWHAELAAGRVVPRDGSILVFDSMGQALVMEWRFERALPVSWHGPTLDALQSKVSIETLELVPERLVRVL